jgi:hypothetical protein
MALLSACRQPEALISDGRREGAPRMEDAVTIGVLKSVVFPNLRFPAIGQRAIAGNALPDPDRRLTYEIRDFPAEVLEEAPSSGIQIRRR